MKEQLKTVVRGRDLLRTAMVSVPVAATGAVSRSSEAEAHVSGYSANSAETRTPIASAGTPRAVRGYPCCSRGTIPVAPQLCSSGGLSLVTE
jgi:hypothetical protein